MASADVEFRCFVGGLAWATNNRSLEEAFSAFAEIVESKIINDREIGRSRGFGFVTFRDEKSIREAIEGMNGQNLDRRNITVKEAQSRRSSGGYNRDGGGYGGNREGGCRGGRREGGYGNGRGFRGVRRNGGYGDGGPHYSRGGGEGNWRS